MNQATSTGSASLISRVRNILLQPKAEWARIADERASIGSIFVPYVLALAAIGPLATLIGGQLFGYGALGFHFKPTLVGGLVTAAVTYGLALVGVFVLALIIEVLAPNFGGTRDRVQALKVAAYSSTAAWVTAVFQIFPPLGVLGILGLYSFYLLYTGLPIVMKAPQEKALGYTIVTVIAAIVLWLIIGAIGGAVTGAFTRGANSLSAGAASITLPGGEKVATNDLEAAARKMEEAANRIAEGGSAVVSPASLAALLPASVGGLPRASQESGQTGIEGMNTSSAQAVYENGDARITLKITDLGDMAALGGLAGALGVQSSRETDEGYERVGKVDGRLTTESWDRARREGEYGVMVADRVQVEAEGWNVEMDALKATVNGVDLRRVEGLVR